MRTALRWRCFCTSSTLSCSAMIFRSAAAKWGVSGLLYLSKGTEARHAASSGHQRQRDCISCGAACPHALLVAKLGALHTVHGDSTATVHSIFSRGL